MNEAGGNFNRERLKSAIKAGKEKYGEYWNENSEKVLKVYQEFLEKIEEGEHPGKIYEELINSKYKELRENYRDIDRLFWFIFGVGGPESLDDASVEKFREYIREIKDAKTENDAWAVLEKYRDAIRGMKIVSLSTWASVIHPEWFCPLWRDRYRGVINVHNDELFGRILEKSRENFYNLYPELVKTIKEAANEAGVSNLPEAAFYLSKYNAEHENKEIGKTENGDLEERIESENSEVFKLLKDKKQIILYGPPGTGKTWLAKKFVDENASKTYKIAKRDILEVIKFFWWSINPNKWDYTQLEEGKSVEMWYGQFKKAFAGKF